jgi:hypothetical protein
VIQSIAANCAHSSTEQPTAHAHISIAVRLNFLFSTELGLPVTDQRNPCIPNTQDQNQVLCRPEPTICNLGRWKEIEMQEPLDKLVDEGGASRCSQSGRATTCYGEQQKNGDVWRHNSAVAYLGTLSGHLWWGGYHPYHGCASVE